MSQHNPAAQPLPVEFIDFPGATTLVVKAKGLTMEQMQQYMDVVFGALGARIGSLFTPAGPAFARYDMFSDTSADVEAGFPIDPATAPSTQQLAELEPTAFGPIEISTLPAGQIAATKHLGSYDGLAQSWSLFIDQLTEDGYQVSMPCWETYDTDPTPDMDPSNLITGLAVPVAKAS